MPNVSGQDHCVCVGQQQCGGGDGLDGLCRSRRPPAPASGCQWLPHERVYGHVLLLVCCCLAARLERLDRALATEAGHAWKFSTFKYSRTCTCTLHARFEIRATIRIDHSVVFFDSTRRWVWRKVMHGHARKSRHSKY